MKSVSVKNQFQPEALKILKANTRGGRMEALREEARILSLSMKDAQGKEKDQMIARSKEILAEYNLHHKVCIKKNNTLVQDLDKELRKLKQNSRYISMDVSADQAEAAMKNLADGTSDPVSVAQKFQRKTQVLENTPKKNAPGPGPELG